MKLFHPAAQVESDLCIYADYFIVFSATAAPAAPGAPRATLANLSTAPVAVAVGPAAQIVVGIEPVCPFPAVPPTPHASTLFSLRLAIV